MGFETFATTFESGFLQNFHGFFMD